MPLRARRPSGNGPRPPTECRLHGLLVAPASWRDAIGVVVRDEIRNCCSSVEILSGLSDRTGRQPAEGTPFESVTPGVFTAAADKLIVRGTLMTLWRWFVLW